MNKKRIEVLLVLGLISCIALGLGMIKKFALSSKAFRVAIFEPATHAALQEIKAGFTYTLRSLQPHVAFECYNGNGDPTLLRSQAENIIVHDYDLIFTIGASCSKAIKELLYKKRKKTPLVFTAVYEPEHLGLLDGTVRIAGIKDSLRYEQQCELFQSCDLTLKKVLLVYNPREGTGLQEHAAALEAILERLNLRLQCVEIFSTQEIMQKVPPFIQECDVVMILKDHTACTGLSSLVKLCSLYNKILFASDLNSCDQGAHVAFGVYEYDYGRLAANKAHQLLTNTLSDPCVEVIDSYEFKVSPTLQKDHPHFLKKEFLNNQLGRKC